jgi:hypothetical protein
MISMGVLHPSLRSTQLNILETREGFLNPLSAARSNERLTQLMISEAREGLLGLLSAVCSKAAPFFVMRKYFVI